MPEVFDLSDPDFTAQMQGLVEEAQQVMGSRAPSGRPGDQKQHAAEEATERAPQSLPQMLQPFVQGLAAITRATGENTQLLKKLDKTSSESVEPLQQLPGAVADLRGIIEKKDALSKQMFDALHEELRTYKDGFLLDSVHRPMIRDLIALYDDLCEIYQQMGAVVREGDEAQAMLGERLRTIEVNIEHKLEFVLEVLARLEVSQLPIGIGKLDKQLQRAIAVESAETPEEDLDVVRTVKRGFLWKDRVVRAEEVVIKKWKEGFLVALHSDI